MKVLICGARDWTDFERILLRLKELARSTNEPIFIIQGGAKGADTISRQCAEILKMNVIEFSADWEKYGKKAGPLRNIQMLNEKPDLVLAFHRNLLESKGTAHTVREAKKRKIPVEVIER